VDDLVDGLLLAAESGERLREGSSPGHGIYFIAGGEWEDPTYTQFGQAIARSLDQRPPTALHLPGPLLRLAGIGGDIIGSIRHQPTWINSDKVTEALAAGSWTCSSAKARSQLGWLPVSHADLTDRLRETAQWYRHAGWL